MPYTVQITNYNQYRCSCCYETDEPDPQVVPTVEEALQVAFSVNPRHFAVSVVDDSTGEKVAWGELCWPKGIGSRENEYLYTCWKGTRPDTGDFEEVRNRQGELLSRSWKQVLHDLTVEQQQAEIQQLELALEEARKALVEARMVLMDDKAS
jgi:hypothetical protein